jgi:hypothetical protein
MQTVANLVGTSGVGRHEKVRGIWRQDFLAWHRALSEKLSLDEIALITAPSQLNLF